ncbi:MAG TPA: Hpt domain-containing protein [Gemmatimonadaceae bacterium]|nr:Hpt domain-containing protein [Gemmatimonadaceae bacterium]
MTRADGVLDMFIVEATEYVDRLDALLATSRDAVANVDAWVRYARALRGSATMFRQSGIARLAGALDAVVHALRAGTVQWDAELHALATATVDDLRVLLRNARAWSADDDRRVAQRTAELERLVPAPAAPGRPAPSGSPRSSLTYLASQAGELADALERLVANPADRTLVTNTLQRVRALRGVAELRDMPLLPEIGERVERAAQAVEINGGAPSDDSLALFSAAARLLWRASGDLAAGRRPNSDVQDRLRFDAAVAALPSGAGGEHIVPISELFYDDEDSATGIVNAAQRPPTTALERFRLEVGSQAEHLRRLVADARAAGDSDGIDRAARALQAAVRALGGAAESFGARHVADLLRTWGERLLVLDHGALGALDGAALLLADPAVRGEELTARLARLSPETGGNGGAAAARPALRAPAPPADRPPSRSVTPTGRELRAFLENGIAGLSGLEEQPLSEPRALGDEDIVPVESLLYRGRAAVVRAMELRDALRTGGAPPSPDTLDELYALLELAATE